MYLSEELGVQLQHLPALREGPEQLVRRPEGGAVAQEVAHSGQHIDLTEVVCRCVWSEQAGSGRIGQLVGQPSRGEVQQAWVVRVAASRTKRWSSRDRCFSLQGKRAAAGWQAAPTCFGGHRDWRLRVLALPHQVLPRLQGVAAECMGARAGQCCSGASAGCPWP